MEIEKGTTTLHARLKGETLKPCPFCGSTDLELLNTHTPCYWIACTECGAEVTGDAYQNDTEVAHLNAANSAIEKWNRRV